MLVFFRDESESRLAFIGLAGDFTCSREVFKPLLPTLLRFVFIWMLDWSTVAYVALMFGFGLLLVVLD